MWAARARIRLAKGLKSLIYSVPNWKMSAARRAGSGDYTFLQLLLLRPNRNRAETEPPLQKKWRTRVKSTSILHLWSEAAALASSTCARKHSAWHAAFVASHAKGLGKQLSHCNAERTAIGDAEKIMYAFNISHFIQPLRGAEELTAPSKGNRAN